MKTFILFIIFLSFLFPFTSHSETLQSTLKHKELIFIQNTELDDCLFKEFDGDMYMLTVDKEYKQDSTKAIIKLKNITSNTEIPIASFCSDKLPSIMQGYSFISQDFDLNDDYLVVSNYVFLYVFKKENSVYRFEKIINSSNSYEAVKIKGNQIYLLTANIPNGSYVGDYKILDLGNETFTSSQLIKPELWQLLYFQPRKIVDFFQDSYLQSEIVRPVIYFHNKSSIDTVNFYCPEWLTLPDSIINQLKENLESLGNINSKNVIDMLRTSLSQTSLIHKVMSISEDRVLVLWSVPDTKLRYDFRFTIIKKVGQKYEIVANNLSNMELDINKSLADYNGLYRLTNEIFTSNGKLIDILPTAFYLSETHQNMPIIDLYREMEEAYLKSDENGFYLNIMEIKND